MSELDNNDLEEVEQPSFPLVKAKENATQRAVIVTMFNYTPAHVDMFKNLVAEGKATYVVFQEEITPKTGRPHIQGYVEFAGPTKWSFLKREIGHMYICGRKGTPDECRAYCSKQKTRKPGTSFYEFGNISKGQGRRKDLDDVQEQIDSGRTVKEYSKTHFNTFLKFRKSLEAYEALHAKPRTQYTVCICLWGAADSGKSLLARQLFPDSCWLDLGNSGCWFDLYHGQETVVFDEFSGWIKFNQFKRMVDMHPFSVDSKGSTKVFTSRFAVFTSNQDPFTWYDKPEAVNVDAFDRRIHFSLEAVKAKDVKGNTYKTTLVIHRCFLPYGSNMRDTWKLHGLSHDESMELLCFETTMNRRKDLVSKSVTKLQLRSAGVILYPAHDRNGTFYDETKNVLSECLFAGENSSVPVANGHVEARDNECAGAIDGAWLNREISDMPDAPTPAKHPGSCVPIKPASVLLAEMDAQQALNETHDVEWDNNKPDPVALPADSAAQPCPPSDKWAQATFAASWKAHKALGKPYPVQIAKKAAAGTVRMDQLLTKHHKPQPSKYAGFGTNAYDHDSDEEDNIGSADRVKRTATRQKKRMSPYIDDEAAEDDDPRYKRTQTASPELDEEEDDDSFVAPDEEEPGGRTIIHAKLLQRQNARYF